MQENELIELGMLANTLRERAFSCEDSKEISRDFLIGITKIREGMVKNEQ